MGLRDRKRVRVRVRCVKADLSRGPRATVRRKKCPVNSLEPRRGRMSIVASPQVANPVGVKCSCAQLYAAPNGARKSTSASVTMNIAPLRGCRAELDSPP